MLKTGERLDFFAPKRYEVIRTSLYSYSAEWTNTLGIGLRSLGEYESKVLVKIETTTYEIESKRTGVFWGVCGIKVEKGVDLDVRDLVLQIDNLQVGKESVMHLHVWEWERDFYFLEERACLDRYVKIWLYTKAVSFTNR